jgi:hypothetical protein
MFEVLLENKTHSKTVAHDKCDIRESNKHFNDTT